MNSDPLLWWTVNGKKYPRLSKLAKRLLCVPASSTASERSFSTSGHIAEQRRASLTPANINMLVVLNKKLVAGGECWEAHAAASGCLPCHKSGSL